MGSRVDFRAVHIERKPTSPHGQVFDRDTLWDDVDSLFDPPSKTVPTVLVLSSHDKSVSMCILVRVPTETDDLGFGTMSFTILGDVLGEPVEHRYGVWSGDSYAFLELRFFITNVLEAVSDVDVHYGMRDALDFFGSAGSEHL